METTNESSAIIRVKKEKVVSKQMDVFYNPVMAFNRDISIILLNSIQDKNLQIADPMAASGVRSIRFLKELDKSKIKKIYINDYDKRAINSIIANFRLNKINLKNKIEISGKDANIFLLQSTGFDYIDIDPFGTPNPFLDAACRRISRDGILAVTATDTSALCGTYPDACMRKYWASPDNGPLMHEIGLRILIRKIQLIGSQFDKALIPIFSYSKDHYMRVFLRNEKRKSKVDEILKLHGMLAGSGPMWVGNLFDSGLCAKMHSNAMSNKFFKDNKELLKFLSIIKEESKIETVGFYDVDDICSRRKISTIPKKHEIIKKVKQLSYKVSETHFKGDGLRSDIPLDQLVRILKSSR